MARIRSIKPEFWSSGQVIECSPMARLLFIGMWNFADDYGHLSVSEKRLKAQVFPGDDEITSSIVRRLIDELSTNGLVRFYVIENKEYIEITGWHHQKIDRPNCKAALPKPEDGKTGDRRMIVDASSIARDGSNLIGSNLSKEGSKSSEAKASAAGAAPAIEKPPDIRTVLFHDGLASLREITGKTDSGCRQLLGHWLKDALDDAGNVLQAIQSAKSDRVADPVAWITAALKPRPPNWRDRPELRGVL